MQERNGLRGVGHEPGPTKKSPAEAGSVEGMTPGMGVTRSLGGDGGGSEAAMRRVRNLCDGLDVSMREPFMLAALLVGAAD